MEDQGRGIKVEVRGSRSGEGSRLGVKVEGQGLRRGQGFGIEVVVKVGGQDRGRGQGWRIEVVVKVGGQNRGRGQCWGSMSGEGSRFGESRLWSRSGGGKVRGMIDGHKVGRPAKSPD